MIHLLDKLTFGSPCVCQTKLYLEEKVKRHGTIYIGWIFKLESLFVERGCKNIFRYTDYRKIKDVLADRAAKS